MLDDDLGERIVAELVGEAVEVEVLSIDPWKARAWRFASSYGSGRIYLQRAMHRALLNPPWGGHGFNTGVGDAVNLGWKLDAVLAGWGGPGLLASYEAERRPIAAETIALAEANMRVLAVDLADPRLEQEGAVADELRRAVALRHPGGQVPSNSTASASFSATPMTPSPIVAGEPGAPTRRPPSTTSPIPAPARLPRRWLAPGRSTLYDALGPEFVHRVVRAGAVDRVDRGDGGRRAPTRARARGPRSRRAGIRGPRRPGDPRAARPACRLAR